MTDRFYRATQALKRLPAIHGIKGEAAKSGTVTPDKIALVSDLLDANVAKADIADRVGLHASTIYNLARKHRRGNLL
tara:strand:- start:131 stop:361 length:231 start_codon:yes stop_codon:yes gene_type:complete